MFRSNRPEDMAVEVKDAYLDRIRVMNKYGDDSPEGLVAEEIADQKAAAFRAQTGQAWYSA